MQRLLSPEFNTNYLGAEKVDIFTGSISSCTSCKEPVPMKQHGSLDIRPGLSNIGFTVLSQKVLSGCGRVSGLGARLACLPRICRGYETRDSALQGNRGTTKTSGLGNCW